MTKEKVVVKKNTSEHLAPGGRGWHEVPGEGVLNKEHFIGTPSSPLWGTSKAEILFYNPPTPLRGTSPARGAEQAAVCAKHPARGEVNGGFTLIELLVVVLIIGILAAVAVPQYKKAVLRSRNTEIKQLVKAVAQAQKAYFLTNGKYAANFKQLDLDLPLAAPVSAGTESQYSSSNLPCNLGTMGPDAIRRGKDFDIVLNTTNLSTSMSIVGIFTKGPYKCAGFVLSLSTGILYCFEHDNLYTNTRGAFCNKIENGTQVPGRITRYNIP